MPPELGGKPMPHIEWRPAHWYIVHRIHIQAASQVTLWTLIQSSLAASPRHTRPSRSTSSLFVWFV